jgi:tetratricopeptide (TPR) repeat protein
MTRLSALTTLTLAVSALALAQDAVPADWRKARDTQDHASLERISNGTQADANQRGNDANAQYRAALAESLRAEVLAEQKDKKGSGAAAESGIRFAEKAVGLNPNNAEFHRLWGALCGQTIPANLLFALRYGHCAMDEVNKAIQLNPKSSMAWVSKGVGNYYLPANFGGGPEQALKDLEKATQLDSGNADAWLWQGIVLRKLNRNAEARKAFEKSLALNSARVWAKQQLDKTPPQ